MPAPDNTTMVAPSDSMVSPQAPELITTPAINDKDKPAISDHNGPPAGFTVSPEPPELDIPGHPMVGKYNDGSGPHGSVSQEPPELDIPGHPMVEDNTGPGIGDSVSQEPPVGQTLPAIWQGPPPPPEHPEGDAIRKQVEFYFSDENLPTDEHLLEKCGNHDNLPVSIRSICGFKKMRRFKPYLQVVASLKKSAFLDVVEGNKIKRKIPLMARTVLDKGADDLDSDMEDGEGIKEKPNNEDKDDSPPKKQQQQPKQEKKPKITVTGFEEWYAEPPIDPKEHQEEVEMYDPDISFRLRMETAIQRFKMRRKFQSVHRSAFDKLMRFGGVDSGQRQFTGGPKDPMLDQHDAAERALMLATHQIDDSREDETRWVVDFEGIAKGFLSCHYPYWVSHRPADIKNATAVMRSFYNYLQYHNVCPEYKSQLDAAKAVCDLADSEYDRLDGLNVTLPGPFNMAVSTLIGGYYASQWIQPGTWNNNLNPNDPLTSLTSISPTESRFIFKLAIAVLGADPKYTNINQSALLADPTRLASAPIETLDGIGLCITDIIQPTQAAIDLYAAANVRYTLRRDVQPLGKIRCVPFQVDPFLQPDIPVSERRARRRHDKTRTYEFWIEHDLLDELFVGLRFQARVKRVTLKKADVNDHGRAQDVQALEVIDQVQSIVPSFYAFLENELLDNWKEPSWFDDDEREALEAGQAEKEMPKKVEMEMEMPEDVQFSDEDFGEG